MTQKSLIAIQNWTVTVILIMGVSAVTAANGQQVAPVNPAAESDALKSEIAALARQIEELKKAQISIPVEKPPDPMLSEVLAAGINSSRAMEMLGHHAELLALIYGIAGTLLGGGLAFAAWAGLGRLKDIKEDLNESLQSKVTAVESKLTTVKDQSDRDHQQVTQVLSWHTTAESRIREMTDKSSTRFAEVELDASLRATYNECSQLSLTARVL